VQTTVAEDFARNLKDQIKVAKWIGCNEKVAAMLEIRDSIRRVTSWSLILFFLFWGTQQWNNDQT